MRCSEEFSAPVAHKPAGVQFLAMPKAFLRILAVALLAFAVPLQGMASVTAGQCMAFNHHGDAGDQDGHHAHDEAQDAQAATQLHCGPCAACCASASIAAPVALLIPASPSEAKYFFSQFPPLAVEPHGLYRPPLSL
jgi:hypothetical protein